MTAAGFRRIALSLSDTEESSHQGVADFRVSGRIFATLAYEKDGFGVLALTPEQQSGMVQDAPDLFEPVPGGWGRRGMTLVRLSAVTPEVLEGVLQLAWENRKSSPRRKRGRQR